MTILLHFVENKVTGISETVPSGVAEGFLSRSGTCLMCGHTPGRAVEEGKCCPCGDCICCAKFTRPEES